MPDAGADADGERVLSVSRNGESTVRNGFRVKRTPLRFGAAAPREEASREGRYRCGSIRAQLPQDVAMDRSASSHEIRKASQSHAFDWPVPGEGRSPNGPADGEAQMKMANAFCRYLEMAEQV